ncbi:MAG TPA: DUF4023 family protein [Desulfosporosinus sp.]|nr:DUF4023 family protein [Desulfosporosinus sp.]
MESIDKIQDAQEKANKNQEHQGKRNPDKKLPSKQHSTNK